MCDSHKNDKHSKGDEDMEAVKNQYERQFTPKNLQMANRVAENLVNKKTVIECKDGVAQIDKDHPDYDFWMED